MPCRFPGMPHVNSDRQPVTLPHNPLPLLVLAGHFGDASKLSNPIS